ncbi:unnamed protein product [Meloidogyne enterolobii]|uniref:Uncharacterized protein n=1 Tax=Meloidogyne enterolobii TaxID=390850 RepID=A0ACB0ZG65_MELEN
MSAISVSAIFCGCVFILLFPSCRFSGSISISDGFSTILILGFSYGHVLINDFGFLRRG